jgi:hypothetical protein
VRWAIGVVVAVVLVIAGFIALFNVFPEYNRYQSRLNAENQVLINEIIIRQQEQNIQVEKQKAAIRIVEAQGIAEAQRIINATLTDKYLQHEAIGAQEKMANSPNHTTIYIPSGQNGIPLVQTTNP